MLDYVFPPIGDFWIFVDNGELGETNEPSPAIMLFWMLAWGGIVFRFSKISKEQLIYLLCATVSMIIQSGGIYLLSNKVFIRGNGSIMSGLCGGGTGD